MLVFTGVCRVALRKGGMAGSAMGNCLEKLGRLEELPRGEQRAQVSLVPELTAYVMITSKFVRSVWFEESYWLIALALLVLLSGCMPTPIASNGDSKSNPFPSDGKAFLSIEFNWDDFAQTTIASQAAQAYDQVTSIGALLIYVEENAILGQSVTKEMAETKGVITLEVPPTKKANLFVAAVTDGPGLMSGKARLIGVINDLVISNQSTSRISLQDFELMEPVL